jgi:tetratricopeptide (TPR) repeat protein
MERAGLQHVESYAAALWLRGVNAYHADELTTALALFERSVAAYRQHRPQDPTHSTATLWIANVLIQRDELVAAEGRLQDALVIAQQGEQRDSAVGNVRSALGDLYQRMGRHVEAEAELARSHELSLATDGGRNVGMGISLTRLARSRHQIGQRAQAQADMQAALEIGERHAGPRVGNLTDRANATLAAMGADEGDIAAALPRARSLSARWSSLPLDVSYAARLSQQAELESLAGHAEAAREVAAQALPIIEAALGADVMAARASRLVFAEVAERHAAGEADRRVAREAYAAVLAPAKVDLGASKLPAREWQRARATLGLARLALPDDAALALRQARGVVAMFSASPRLLGEQLVLAQARLVEGRALQAQGSPEEARTAFEAAVALLEKSQVPASPRLAEVRHALAAPAFTQYPRRTRSP